MVPIFCGSASLMLWMFSSKMYSKRGHNISKSVSQYLQDVKYKGWKIEALNPFENMGAVSSLYQNAPSSRKRP